MTARDRPLRRRGRLRMVDSTPPSPANEPLSTIQPGAAPAPDGEAATPAVDRGVGRGKSLTRGVRRWFLRGCLAALLLAITLALTWPSIVAWFVASSIGEQLGADASIGAITHLGDGRFRISDLEVNAPGWRGPAAKVVTIRAMELDLDTRALLRGSFRVDNVDIRGMVMRVAERASSPGTFNLTDLQLGEGDATDPDAPLPTVTIHDCLMERGVVDRGEYRQIGSRRFTGILTRLRDEPGWMALALAEVDANGRPRQDGLDLDLAFDRAGGAMRVSMKRFVLDDHTWAFFPLWMRVWHEQLALQGAIDSATLVLERNRPVQASLSIRDASMRMPTIDADVWSRFADGKAEALDVAPMLTMRSGTITLDDRTLRLERLSGELLGSDAGLSVADDPGAAAVAGVTGGAEGAGDAGGAGVAGVPFQIRGFMRMTQTAALSLDEWRSWTDEAMRNAAFEIEIELPEFCVQPDETGHAPAVEIPSVLARALERFNLRTWTLSMNGRIERGEPVPADDGRSLHAAPVRIAGQAYITDAAGSYFRFPYPLRDARASLRFDNETINVEYLVARGSGESEITIRGLVQSPGPAASSRMDITVRNVPLDDALLTAMPPGGSRILRSLISHEAERALERAGLLPTEHSLARAREERQGVVAELRDAVAAGVDEERIETLQRRSEQLARVLQAGLFRLGAVADAQLTVEREAGLNKPNVTTGTVDLKQGGLLLSRFPYPAWITGGRLVLEPEVIRFDGEGIGIVTAGGGQGRVTGQIHRRRVDGVMRTSADVQVAILDDAPNALLYAAIPPGVGDRRTFPVAVNGDGQSTSDGAELIAGPPVPTWPGLERSAAAELLDELNLRGSLSTVVHVTQAPDAEPQWEAVVRFEHGSAAPTNRIGGAMADLGLVWPEGFEITSLHAELDLTSRLVRLRDLSGHSGLASISGSGESIIRPNGNATEARFTFVDLPLEEYLLDLLPRGNLDAVRQLWERYEPGGRFDATIIVNHQDNEPAEVSVEVVPREVECTLPSGRTWMKGRGGSISLSTDIIRLNRLLLETGMGDRSDGDVFLNGSYGFGPGGGELAVNGRWTGARFESGIVREAMELLRLRDQRDLYEELDPQGLFDATFFYTSPVGDRPSRYRLEFEPRRIDLLLRGERLSLNLEEGSRAILSPGRIDVPALRGTHGDGSFSIAGELATPAPGPGDFTLSADSQGLSPFVRAVLPEGLRRTLEESNVTIDGRLAVVDAALSLRPSADGSSWNTTFDGPLEFNGAAFEAGLRFSEITGGAQLRASGGGGDPVQLQGAMRVDTMRVQGRLVERMRGEVFIEDQGARLVMPDLRGSVGSGGAFARVEAGLGDHHGFEVVVEVVEAPLERLAEAGGEPTGSSGSTTGASPADGTVNARVALEGVRGHPELLIGRGEVRLRDARVARMPILLRVIQLAALMPPLADCLSGCNVSFYINGSQLVFEHLDLESDVLRLVGGGTMTVPGLELDVRLVPRGRVALVSDLVGGLSDRIYAISVTGALQDPKASIVPLPDVIQHRQSPVEPPQTTESSSPLLILEPAR